MQHKVITVDEIHDISWQIANIPNPSCIVKRIFKNGAQYKAIFSRNLQRMWETEEAWHWKASDHV